MTEEERPEQGYSSRPTVEPLSNASLQVADRVEGIIEKLTVAGSVSAAFGEASTVGDRTIIPVARVSTGGGFGFGSGQAEAVQDTAASGGSGAGGGAGAMATPIAAIVVTPEEVRVQPIVDVTKVTLAAIASLAFNLYWVLRFLRAVRIGEHAEVPRGEVTLGKVRKLFRC